MTDMIPVVFERLKTLLHHGGLQLPPCKRTSMYYVTLELYALVSGT